MSNDIVSIIKSFPLFEGVPEEEIKAYINLSKIESYSEDDILVRAGDEVDYMLLILEGEIKLEIKHGDKFVRVDHFGPGQITGKLPFSRMQVSIAYLTATKDTRVITTRESLFPEMARNYRLIEAMVHALSDRVRNFTTIEKQNEKLMALGKLSAGLAHELNNPASAMVRSADELKKHLKANPEKFKAVMRLKLTDRQVDDINEVVFKKMESGIDSLSLMEKTSREDELAAWMDNHNIGQSFEYAETFAEYGFTTADLEEICAITDSDSLAPVLAWMDDVLVTERIIDEIGDASRRISGLVSSVKTYSHMDQANEKEAVNLRNLIQNTLNILNHKIKKKQIKVEVEIPDDLPAFLGYVSDLNQVWMNLLDNSIDAVPEKGNISVRAETRNGDVHILFGDNGEGIPPEIQSRIFDPFFTTKKIGEGTGMGLDLVRKIIQKHEGEIKVKSEPGQTLFDLRLPGIHSTRNSISPP